MSPKRSRSTRGKPSSVPPLSPPVARAGGCVLRSATVGPLPLVNRLLRRMRLEESFRDALPKEDGRTKLSPTKALLVLLRYGGQPHVDDGRVFGDFTCLGPRPQVQFFSRSVERCRPKAQDRQY